MNEKLCRAVINCDATHVKALLEAGADPDTRFLSGVPVLAHTAGVPEIVRLLIEAGANIEVLDNDGKRPLHFAAEWGTVKTVKALLEAGADPNVCDANGLTPLHGAAEFDSTATVKVLIEAGADVNAKAHHDWTPLHDAAFWASEDTVRLLLDAGADPTARNAHGKTPLDRASECGRAKIGALMDEMTEEESCE